MTETAYKRDDTVPLKAVLPVDLTGASVTFKLSSNKDSTEVTGNATVTDAANGVVQYQWQSGETDRVGLHYMEWEVTYSDGGVETFPRDGFDRLYFYDDL